MRRNRPLPGGRPSASARLLPAALLLTALLPAAARAQTLPVSGIQLGPDSQTIASFEGSLLYQSTSSTGGTLTLSLTNTGPTTDGGYLTAIAFHLRDGISLTSVSSNPGGLLSNALNDAGGVNVAPYGRFDAGASGGKKADFLGSGQPSLGGLAPGDSVVLTFTLTGVGMDQLTTQEILTPGEPPSGKGKKASSPQPSGDPVVLLARFRGFDSGTSYKVPGYNDPVPMVPEPGSLALLLPGLAPLGFVLRRRRG